MNSVSNTVESSPFSLEIFNVGNIVINYSLLSKMNYLYCRATFYFFIICFEMTYGKVITNSVRMDSSWGPVYYTNMIGILPTLALGILLHILY